MRLLVFLSLLFFSLKSFSQPILPDIEAISQKGINMLGWTSQYEGIKSIGVQRSNDSIYNFVTIGYVKNLKKGVQGYIDGHPLPGKNYYRLYIVFASDLTWYSNRVKLRVDSSFILKQQNVLPNDSLQKYVDKIDFKDTSVKKSSSLNGFKTNVNFANKGLPNSDELDPTSYIRSQYVFVNPFTGHVNIELKDAKDKKYSLIFYYGKSVAIKIEKVPENIVVIDKRNFQHKGIYHFELYKNDEKIERGQVILY